MGHRLALFAVLVAGCYHDLSFHSGNGPGSAWQSPVAIGDAFGCALTSGQLACWGRNVENEVAAGSADQVPTPQLIPGSWKQVAAGAFHACAIGSDDSLSCWGLDSSGQCSGEQSAESKLPPTAVSIDGVAAWRYVSAGFDHTCGIATDGSLHCWGDNSTLALGSADKAATTNAVAIPGPDGAPLTDWIVVKAGQRSTCAASASTGLWCWGNNPSGALGNGGVVNPAMPQQTSPVIDDVTSIAMTSNATCAVTTAGALYCWGAASSGELGDAAPTGSGTFATPMLSPTDGWTAVASSAALYMCGLRGSDMSCWGQANNGGLGTGAFFDAKSTFSPTTSGVAAFAVGFSVDQSYFFGPIPFPYGIDYIDFDTTCAVVDAGLTCWGDDTYGQLGNGTSTRETTPQPVMGLPLSSGGQLAVGESFACAEEGGAVYCWGDNQGGELDADDSTNAPSVSGSAVNTNLTNVTAIAAGLGHTCALHDGGELRCWGNDAQMQLSGGASPVEVPTDGSAFSALVVSYDTSCAFHGESEECFGLLAPFVDGETPTGATNEATFDDVSALAFGGDFACELTTSSDLFCTGNNSLGQFGDGTTTSLGSGTFNTSGPQLEAVAASPFAEYMCGVSTTAMAACWGVDYEGQLAQGGSATTTSSSMPVPIPDITDCSAVAAGYDVACAICEGGSNVHCWGGDQFGGTGDGASQVNTPVPPTTLSANGDLWTQIGAGLYFTCAMHASGAVDCWGRGTAGELGNGAAQSNRPGVTFVQL